MKEIRVQSGFPIPKSRNQSSPYPWKDMKKIGDSFFVPVGNGRAVMALQNSILGSGRNKGFKTQTHITTENAVRGVRVWRIS